MDIENNNEISDKIKKINETKASFEDKINLEKNKLMSYNYYLSSTIDWEIIRIQPLRYLWNESDQLTLYGTTISIIYGTYKLSTEEYCITKNKFFNKIINMKTFLYLKNKWETNKILQISKSRINKIRSNNFWLPFLYLNIYNISELYNSYGKPLEKLTPLQRISS